MQLSSEEGFPETAVKARMRLSTAAVAIVSHLKNSFYFSHFRRQTGGKVFMTILEQWSSLLGMCS